MILLTTHADARDAFRQRDLRQALYDEGDHLMNGVIVNLHGPEHLARRRLENRLFRRDTFAWYERDVIPRIIASVLASALATGQGDLLQLARRTMLTLSLDVAGIDRSAQRIAPSDGVTASEAAGREIDRLYELMDRLARASTVGHAVGDKSAIIADGDAALGEFEQSFFAPSLARRQALVEQHGRGEIDDDQLPRDVLTTLIRNQDHLDLPASTVLREVAYFPWVGSHSTSNQFVHAMHHIFTWLDEQADRGPTPGQPTVSRRTLAEDPLLRQRFVHESLRLHPASPVALRQAVAPITLRSGVEIPAGAMVSISLHEANRDPAVFGPEAATFDPFRELPDGVTPWGLSFGHGLHACLGQELAGGVEPTTAGPESDELQQHLLGAITVMTGLVLAADARPDPDDPAVLDTSTTRQVFSRYPVRYS